MSTFLKVVVLDRPGVLDRIVGLIRRKGWNIDKLSAADIDERLSQLNFAISGRGLDLSGLGEFLAEMDTVRSWAVCTEADHVIRELLLFQVAAAQRDWPQFAACRLLAEEAGRCYLEYSGSPAEAAELLSFLRQQQIRFTRTGAALLDKAVIDPALERRDQDG